MVFDYYYRLGRNQQAIYKKSDAIEQVKLSDPKLIWHYIHQLEDVLSAEDRKKTEQVTVKIVNGVLSDLRVMPVRMRVLSARPSNNWGELHGLYEPVDGKTTARITVWMRTARHKRVVAFRSYLRTVLHELCHHLDYEFYRLADSYHTEGFFKRESSLFRQLVPTNKHDQKVQETG